LSSLFRLRASCSLSRTTPISPAASDIIARISDKLGSRLLFFAAYSTSRHSGPSDSPALTSSNRL
jgi:hypothetical protein